MDLGGSVSVGVCTARKVSSTFGVSSVVEVCPESPPVCVGVWVCTQ